MTPVRGLAVFMLIGIAGAIAAGQWVNYYNPRVGHPTDHWVVDLPRAGLFLIPLAGMLIANVWGSRRGVAVAGFGFAAALLLWADDIQHGIGKAEPYGFMLLVGALGGLVLCASIIHRARRDVEPIGIDAD